MSDEATDGGRWVMECSCGNVLRIKNLAWRASKAEPCDFCRMVMAGEDDTFERGVARGLGWCGCGTPDLVDELMLDYLQSVERKEVLSDDPAALLLAYIADDTGWTDHGTSISYVWLTDDGQEALANLRILVQTRAARR